MDLRFPIWKPAPSNDDPSRVRIQESIANLVDRMQFALLPLNAAGHMIPSVLSNCFWRVKTCGYLTRPTYFKFEFLC